MPGLVKIGLTTRSVSKRAAELSTTSVPYLYTEDFSFHFDNVRKAERDIHTILSLYRVSKQREFFRISVNAARKIIETYYEEPPESTEIDAAVVALLDIPAVKEPNTKTKKKKNKKAKAESSEPTPAEPSEPIGIVTPAESTESGLVTPVESVTLEASEPKPKRAYCYRKSREDLDTERIAAIEKFIEAFRDTHPTLHTIYATELYNNYSEWGNTNNVLVLSHTIFGRLTPFVKGCMRHRYSKGNMIHIRYYPSTSEMVGDIPS